MKKAYTCFIADKERPGYIEIPFEEFLHLQETDPAFQQKRFVLLYGVLLEVPPEVYKDFHKQRRRRKYLQEEAICHQEVSYHALDTDEWEGESILEDESQNIEDEAVSHVMHENLRMALQSLSSDEMTLIDALYFKEKSEREWSEETGIAQKTINNRRRRILDKLLNLLENRK